jgi:hypothetical protein
MGSNKRYPRDHHGPDATQRHCWVLRTRDATGPWPGLILEWRRQGSGDWAARVVYIPDHRQPRSVEDWFHQSHLRPADTWPSDEIRREAKMPGGL